MNGIEDECDACGEFKTLYECAECAEHFCEGCHPVEFHDCTSLHDEEETLDG